MLRAWSRPRGKRHPAVNTAPRPAPRLPHRVRPALESLEDRLALSLSPLTVSSAQDPATLTPGTLRYAVNQANQDAALGLSDTIVFNTALMGTDTITLSQGQLELKSGGGTVTIDGGGTVTVSGNNASRVFQVDGGAQAVLKGLTVSAGLAAGNTGAGGGIENEGSLAVNGCVFSNNHAGWGGGGIDNNGYLMVEASTFTGNSANTGGGLFNGSQGGGSVLVGMSTFANNSADWGGGIANWHGMLLASTTVTGNSAGDDAGGINNLTVSGSLISLLTGLPQITAQLTLYDTIVAGNTGNDPDVGSGQPALFGVQAAINPLSSYNLIGNGSGLSGIGNGDANHNLIGTGSNPLNALLGPLGNYGGPTPTMPLLPGSPALGAGGAVGTLGTDVDATAATIAFPPSWSLPAGTAIVPVVVQIDQEQLLVTAISGNDVTVVRGYNHTTAAAHAAGAAIYLATDQRGYTRASPPDIGAVQTQALTSFTVSAPATATAGVAFTVTVTARDQSGNTFTGYTGPVTLSTNDGQAVVLDGINLTNGTATVTVTLDNPGSVTLTATAGSVKGTSGTIVVQAVTTGTHSELQITGTPPPPPPPLIMGLLISKKVHNKNQLFLCFELADTGTVLEEMVSPFQAPTFKNVQVTGEDTTGDGVPDLFILTAQRGTTTEEAVFMV